MNYLAGIDEAGLGPLLGPLVVAGVALGGPAGEDPWALVEDLVCRHRCEPGKIRVADSKKVHQGRHGLRRLEQTVLGFWGALHGSLPATSGDLLALCGADLARLRRCPWYRELDLPLPLANDRGWIELTAHRLARTLESTGIEILRIAVHPVDVEEFNELIARTHNKSRTHFWIFSRAIAELLDVLPRGAHLVADRCGGIAHYRPGLRRTLPDLEVAVLREDPEISSYRVTSRHGPLRVTFAVQGEERAFPTALASCTAKYVRELMLRHLNRWFGARLPGLRPTAGYYTDGRRFLADVAPLVEAEGLPRSCLVRVR